MQFHLFLKISADRYFIQMDRRKAKLSFNNCISLLKWRRYKSERVIRHCSWRLCCPVEQLAFVQRLHRRSHTLIRQLCDSGGIMGCQDWSALLTTSQIVDPQRQWLIVRLRANRLSQIPLAGRHDSGNDTLSIKYCFFFPPAQHLRVCACVCVFVRVLLYLWANWINFPCCAANWWLLNIHISHFTSQPQTRKCKWNGYADVEEKHAHSSHTHTHTDTHMLHTLTYRHTLLECASDCDRGSAQDVDLKLQTR